jgi:hypothetical protein
VLSAPGLSLADPEAGEPFGDHDLSDIPAVYLDRREHAAIPVLQSPVLGISGMNRDWPAIQKLTHAPLCHQAEAQLGVAMVAMISGASILAIRICLPQSTIVSPSSTMGQPESNAATSIITVGKICRVSGETDI